MSMSLSVLAVLLLMLPMAGLIACNTANASSTALPAAELDAALASTHGQQSAVVAGGCFWGIQAVFQHVKGVIGAVSGYAGGSAQTADYEKVCGGNTGHAESVKVTYDPAQISYGQILRIFFSVAHDPTELNRQGPDSGTQYRSAIFYDGEEQKRVAEAYIAQLNRASVFPRRIVTQVTIRQRIITRTMPRIIRASPTSCLTTRPRCWPCANCFPSFTPRMRKAPGNEICFSGSNR
jgi:peptide-methionine (S)-S-oxide reductase